MTAEQRRRLGELFYQVDASNTRKKGGTGLGMAITKNFIRMMDGSLEVSSEPGKGTTFTVRLPAVVSVSPVPESKTQKADDVPPAELPSPEPAGPRDLVLVVDDEAEARDLIERFLVKEGLRVRAVGDSKEVLALAKQLRPVAITLDVQMPELDGWTLLAALKTDPATADIPVIMLTLEDNARRGFALGASDYLTKPIDWPRLATVLHRFSRAIESAPILVVEDDPVNRELVCRMLQRENRTAVPAENGRVALERLNQGLKPALILLDLMMPQMDGFQFIEELRRHPEWQGIPVIIVTARDLTAQDRQRLNGGVAQVVSKGVFTPEQLLAQLRARVHQYLHPVGDSSRLTRSRP
jgi:CheY-like chemotaxis protein